MAGGGGRCYIIHYIESKSAQKRFKSFLRRCSKTGNIVWKIKNDGSFLLSIREENGVETETEIIKKKGRIDESLLSS